MTTLEPTGAPSPRAAGTAPGDTDVQPETSGKSTKDPVEKLRAKVRLYWSKRIAKAEEKARGKQRLADTKLDMADSAEKVMLRRATFKRRKMTDSGSHLASIYRSYRTVVFGLMLGTLLCMAWASHNVAHGLDQTNPAPLLYGVEAIFSLPLLAIVFMQVTAAEHDRLDKLRPFRKGMWGLYWPTLTGAIEMGLLSTTVLISAWPALTAEQFSLEKLVTSAGAPVMVVILVMLQLVASELFGPMIRDAWLAGDDTQDTQRERTKRAGSLAKQVRLAMADEQNPMSVLDDGLPSISSIQKRFPSEKLTAQVAHDMLALFQDIEGVN